METEATNRKTSKKMGKRKTGIDDKMVFYVERYSKEGFTTYFNYSTTKIICNPDDPFRFYLKIGGVTYLPKKAVPGKKISSSAERILESNYFGSYVFYGQTDKKIRTLFYTKRKLLPDNKMVTQPASLNSVIPRFSSYVRDLVITGMSIVESSDSNRQWNRYDSDIKEMHTGFWEIDENVDLYNALNLSFNQDAHHIGPPIGIYVGPNTSVLMVDTTRAYLYNDYYRHHVYTLFQEGAFICTSRPFYFAFFDEEEGEEYDITRFFDQKKDKLKGSPNLHLLASERGFVLFLKSAPNLTFWSIRLSKIWRREPKDFILCLPSDAQFEDIMGWQEGIEEVKLRQSYKPWSKYIEAEEAFHLDASPELEHIDLDRDEAYPLMNS